MSIRALGVASAAVLALATMSASALAAASGGPTPIGSRYVYNAPDGPTKGGPGATVPYKSAKEEYEALKAKAKGPGKLGKAQLPDWGGVYQTWPANSAFNVDPSLMRDADQYGPLSPKAQAEYMTTMKNLEKGIEWDPLSACLVSGFPRIMAEGFLHDFAVTPSVVYIIAETQTEVRRVYTDGRPHLPEEDSFPMWEGDSIGFWDGEGENAKLVIWTKSVRNGIYHRNGPPYSEKLEAVEQIWRESPDLIRVEMTFYDPVNLTRPWHVSRGFIRDKTPGIRIVDQWVCAENNNVIQTESGSSDFKLPGEPGYKDPNTLGKQPQ
jgi:hypothetical protein